MYLFVGLIIAAGSAPHQEINDCRYKTDKVACDEMSFCNWDAVPGTCLNSCGLFPFEEMCITDTHCQWSNASSAPSSSSSSTPVCQRKCSSTYTKEDCVALSHCGYANFSCIQVGEHATDTPNSASPTATPPTNPTTAQQCSTLTEHSQCALPTCVLYSTNTTAQCTPGCALLGVDECGATPECSFNTESSLCELRCATFNTERLFCESLKRCAWVGVGDGGRCASEATNVPASPTPTERLVETRTISPTESPTMPIPTSTTHGSVACWQTAAPTTKPTPAPTATPHSVFMTASPGVGGGGGGGGMGGGDISFSASCNCTEYGGEEKWMEIPLWWWWIIIVGGAVFLGITTCGLVGVCLHHKRKSAQPKGFGALTEASLVENQYDEYVLDDLPPDATVKQTIPSRHCEL